MSKRSNNDAWTSQLMKTISNVADTLGFSDEDVPNSSKKILKYTAGSVSIIAVCMGLLFYRDIRHHQKSTHPLGYDPIAIAKNNAIYPKNIKDRNSKDIAKDRFIPSKTKIPKDIDYILIGAGIGSLATAAYLSRVGLRCLVLEKHDRHGGGMHQYSKEYGFDTGIHYIGRKEKYEKQLKSITEYVFDKKNIKPIEFVQFGNKDDGFTYDRFILGNNNEHQIIFNARANKRFEDIREYFQNDLKTLKLIDNVENLANKAHVALTVSIGIRLLPKWLAKIAWFICKYIVYPKVWGKSLTEVLTDLNVYKENRLLAMNLSANIGDLGLLCRENDFGVWSHLVAHYHGGGYYPRGGPQGM